MVTRGLDDSATRGKSNHLSGNRANSPTGQSDSKGLRREPRGHKKVTQGPKRTLFPELDANSGLLPTVSLSNMRGKTGSFRSMA